MQRTVGLFAQPTFQMFHALVTDQQMFAVTVRHIWYGARLVGKAFPLAGTALPAHPLQRGDPTTPPERQSTDGFSVTG